MVSLAPGCESAAPWDTKTVPYPRLVRRLLLGGALGGALGGGGFGLLGLAGGGGFFQSGQEFVGGGLLLFGAAGLQPAGVGEQVFQSFVVQLRDLLDQGHCRGTLRWAGGRCPRRTLIL